MRLILSYITCLLLLPFITQGQFYYGLQQDFGKNRVQYQPFSWTYFGFERYQVYTYEGGQDIAKYVAKQTEIHLKELEKRLDYQTDEKIQVIVYNNQGDFRQSNIGLASDESGNLGGVTKINGTKIALYFTGNHYELDKQLRAGIAELLINDMMYGGRTRDMVKNSTLLVIPDWFKSGLISYLSESWNIDLDDQIMDGISNDRYYSFNRLSGKEATAAGHALWSYVADTYGESVIPNILYMSKVSRNIESAFIFILGTSVSNLTFEWVDAFARRNLGYDTTQYLPTSPALILKPKKTKNYYQLKVSPDGQHVIYATNELSQYKVYLKDLSSNKKAKRLVKSGPKIDRINDVSYPLLAWHPHGEAFAMINEKKGVIYLTTYNILEKEKIARPITGLEKISDFAYSPDGKKLAVAGVKKGKGQSDIFVFTINAGGLEQITNDVWDDSNPRFIGQGERIVFSSNRSNDTLKELKPPLYDYAQHKNHDIFMFDYKKKSKVLMRVTETSDVHESHPGDYVDGYFTYLSESNGTRNHFAAKLDSVISYVDTTEHYRYTFYPKVISNYKRNVVEYDVNLQSKKIGEIFYNNGLQYMYISPIQKPNSLNYELKNSYYRRSQISYFKTSSTTITTTPSQTNETSPKDPSKVDVDNYTFGNEKNKNPVVNNSPADGADPNSPSLQEDSLKNAAKKDFTLPIQQNYYTNFAVDNVVTQLDNSFLNQTYQRFTGYYMNPGMNAFVKIGMSDLFEDYRIVAGFRISGTLNNEYFISVENRYKLWDKQLILHRQSFQNVSGEGFFLKMHTHDAIMKFKYPFSEVSAIKTSLYYRNDQTIYTSIDDISLRKDNQYVNWGGVKTEYIYDNTRSRGLNIYNGWRLKVFAEYLRKADLNKRHDLIVLGFDVRHYLKIHRDFIWANRIAGSTSMGTDRLVYYMGGVDNWAFPRFDNNINILHPEQYQFQTLATNMRGFKQNARNGNNFVVLNSELRLPLFRYFMNRPIRSDFINNFQVIGFADVGSAWYGTSPFSEENTENRTVILGNPINVVLIQQKEPIIAGYGFGFRSRIFGYFVRLDFAWGYDNKIKQDKITYLSFTTDF